MAKVFTKEEIKFIKDLLKFNGTDISNISAFWLSYNPDDIDMSNTYITLSIALYNDFISVDLGRKDKHFYRTIYNHNYHKEDLEKPIDD